MKYWALASTRTGTMLHIVRDADHSTRDVFTFRPACRWVTWDGTAWINTWDIAGGKIPAAAVCGRCIESLNRSIDMMVEARDGMLAHNEALP